MIVLQMVLAATLSAATHATAIPVSLGMARVVLILTNVLGQTLAAQMLLVPTLLEVTHAVAMLDTAVMVNPVQIITSVMK